MTTPTDDLTEIRRHWLEHLRRCEREGCGTRAYAESQGLKTSRLYAWRQRLRPLGVFPAHRGSSAFVPVVRGGPPTPAPAAMSYRLRFPNGLILEWEAAGSEALAPPVADLTRRP